MLNFFIPIEPYPKRTGTMKLSGRKPIFIANKDTKLFEAKVQRFIADSLPKAARYPKEIPVKVVATFYMRRPKTIKRESHTVKPDIDNLAKSLLDSLEGYFFEGDQQVTSLQLRKVYADDNSDVGIMVQVSQDLGD